MIESEEEKHYANAEVIRKKIYSMYKEMVDSISDAHFKPIQDEIKTQTGKNVEMKTAIEVFKKSLYESIEHTLTLSWDDLEVDTSLASLSYAKQAATDKSKKWRPSADVEDKMRPTVIAVKSRTKALYEKQLQYQTKVIEQLVMEVEQERGRLRLQEERCKNVMEQIKRHEEKDQKVAQQIDSIYSVMADISGVEKSDSWIDKRDS